MYTKTAESAPCKLIGTEANEKGLVSSLDKVYILYRIVFKFVLVDFEAPEERRGEISLPEAGVDFKISLKLSL